MRLLIGQFDLAKYNDDYYKPSSRRINNKLKGLEKRNVIRKTTSRTKWTKQREQKKLLDQSEIRESTPKFYILRYQFLNCVWRPHSEQINNIFGNFFSSDKSLFPEI